MNEVQEYALNMARLWEKGELTQVAYQISNLYSSLEYSFILNVMAEFKNQIDGGNKND
ncbi:hypothetical protein AVT25_gp32 [Bacillus phage Pavlov]|uniref:Uncharacterized protein n=1 Tax=Bacillus phage Pookie TaxID=1540093 RepID=A0A0A0RNV9_9CAUD|nr:hypothetical protein CPT_Pookie32 [Bacillus phage Pookie]YP_009197501.1 hypothetical protein AVT25_gp32 [Bacillus phage Pavlov]AIW03717.1 hypothetical protein CPT_Pookie32 [Bacillus phage Pookie]AKQ07453.1 hypothetical protein CPT_Pavlov32 [Bacillus phage Pavlov]